MHHARRPASADGTGAVHSGLWTARMQDRPDQREWRYCQLVYDLRHSLAHDQRRWSRALPRCDGRGRIHGARRNPRAATDRQDDAGDGPLSWTMRQQLNQGVGDRGVGACATQVEWPWSVASAPSFGWIWRLSAVHTCFTRAAPVAAASRASVGAARAIALGGHGSTPPRSH